MSDIVVVCSARPAFGCPALQTRATMCVVGRGEGFASPACRGRARDAAVAIALWESCCKKSAEIRLALRHRTGRGLVIRSEAPNPHKFDRAS